MQNTCSKSTTKSVVLQTLYAEKALLGGSDNSSEHSDYCLLKWEQVHCLPWKTYFIARATHPKSYIANYLHLALFACTALIISLLRGVGNLVFCLHAVCTTCTYLHAVYTYLHGVCPLLYTSVSVCMIGYATYTFWHRGSDFWVRATETTASRYCITALALTWRHAAVAAERW